MESTGKYWVPVFNILEQRGLRVVIANPKWVQAVKGNKDDERDSKWIGDLFRLGLVKGGFIPDKPIRILREFTRYRAKLTAMKSSEKTAFRTLSRSAMSLWIRLCPICWENPQPPLRMVIVGNRVDKAYIIHLG